MSSPSKKICETATGSWVSGAVQLADLIRHHKGRIVVYTGAGISTSTSIPDYRGTHGLWTTSGKNRERNVAGPSTSRATKIQSALKRNPNTPPKLRLPQATFAKPTFTHMAIKALVEEGYVRHVVSQNVDGLHIRSGLPREKLSEFHGNLFVEQCISCETCVFRAFDVAETTAKGRHFTGRICPTCRARYPESAAALHTALHLSSQVILSKLRFPSTNDRMLSLKNAAHHLSTTYQFESGICIGKRPFLLRDVIVHFSEKQPTMGTKLIYRVQSAVEAVYGCNIFTFLSESDERKKRQKRKLRFKRASWSPRRTEPWENKVRRLSKPFTDEDIQRQEGDTSVSDTTTSESYPATLILVLGSSLTVLKQYSFLWPVGLGRCQASEPSCSYSSDRHQQQQLSLNRLVGGSGDQSSQRCILVVNNLQPTCKDGVASLLLRAPCDDVLRVVCDGLQIQVPGYVPERDDGILKLSVNLEQYEEQTRTRCNIKFPTL